LDFSRRLRIFSAGRAIVFTVIIGLVLSVLFRNAGSFDLSYSPRIALATLGLAYLSAWVQWWASRRRYRMTSVALLLVAVDQALFCAVAYVTGGVASGATSLFGVACLVGGLILGIPGALTATLAGILFFSLLVLLTQVDTGILPFDQPEEIYRLTSGQAAYYYVFHLLMLLLVGLLSSYLAERLQRAGGEVKDAHRRAERAERLAALGRLAAGLAHEIRNPLGSISASVQMLRSGAEKEEDRQLCDIVLRESSRLDELVSDMVDLSRQRAPQRTRFDLGRIVSDVVDLVRSRGRGAADVEVVRLGDERAMVHGDSAQIRQLVWNLVRNALQASGSGGQVRVRLQAEPRVLLTVEDDGVGIDSVAKEQLIDAFFTTRTRGRRCMQTRARGSRLRHWG
jgi:signal transduction histidine kinase